MFSASVELLLKCRVPRGDRAPSHAPHARAPAVRARPRPRGRDDPRRLRRRPAAPAARARQVPAEERRAVPARPAAGAGADARASGACCRRPCSTCRAPARARSRPATCSRRCCSSRSRTPRRCSRRRASRGSTSSTTSRTGSRRCRTARISGRGAGRRPRPGRQRRGRTGDGARSARRLHGEPDGAGEARAARSAHRPHVELQRTLEILCRRRKNNPVFVGDPGVGKTAMAEGLAMRLLEADVPAAAEGRRGLLARHDGAAGGHALPRRLRGALQGGDRRRSAKRPQADPVHRRDPLDRRRRRDDAAARSTSRRSIKPVLTAGELRVVGSTTFEEFKHIEKDRALARRLQKVVIEEPTVEETVKILEGLRSRYEDHHLVIYTDEALEGAAQAREAPPARLAAARQRHRHPRRGGRDGAAGRVGLQPTALRPAWPRPSRDGRRGRGALPPRPARAAPPADVPPPARIPVDVDEIERVVARMARIPEKQANASDKQRLRTLDESLRRVVFGQDEAVHAVVAAIKRARAGLGQPDRPAGCFLFTGPDRRRQDGAGQAARAAPRQRVHPLRHVGVHGEARRGAADRRAARLRRLRAGRPAGRRHPAASRTRCCCSTRSRRRTPTSTTSCCR